VRVLLVVGLAVGAGGCWLEEATAPHVDPGGNVQVTVGGPAEKTSAIAHAASEPLIVEGNSPTLTFYLAAADDTAGSTARTDLAQPNAFVQLTLAPASRSRLEVHLDGSGCVAQTGVVHLHTDPQSRLAGDFDASGTDSSGRVCQITGTLDGVPVDR
jgi:hypothetical protein